MGKLYAKSTATLPAGAAISGAALLVAEGYGGNMMGKFFELDPQLLTDVYYGDASTVDATTGKTIPNGERFARVAAHPRMIIDPGQYFFYSATGGDCGVTFESL